MPLTTLDSTRRTHPALQSFTRRTCLACSQEEVWQIREGIARSLTWAPDGTVITLGLWGPNDLLGQSLSKVDPYRIECLTPVKAIALHTSQLSHYTDQLLRHLCLTTQLLDILRGGQAEIVLLGVLNWLAQRFGHQQPYGRQINIRLTHQELADLTGLTRVTVTRLINLFEKRGIIQRHRHYIVVLPEAQPFWHYEI